MYSPVAVMESYISNAVTLNGRATRSEYWWPALVVGSATIAAGLADAMTVMRAMEDAALPPLGITAYWSPILSLVTFVPNFTAAIRRLHDSGRSGGWTLVTLVPFLGVLVYLVLLLMPSERHENAWGSPRDPGVAPPRPRSARPAAEAQARRPLDAYAVLLQAAAEPSPEEIARRRQEVHEYFMRNVSRRATT